MEISVATQTDLANLNVGPDQIGHSVYVTADDAWFTAQFEGRGIDKWVGGAANDNDTPLEALQAAQYPGFNRSQVTLSPAAPVSVVAVTGTVTIPGPAAGFIRVFPGVQYTATTIGNTPIINITHQPSGLVMRRAISVANGAFALAGAYVALAFGETMVVTNTATGVNHATLWYTYFDLPAAGLTTVAAAVVGTTKVSIIPAAPAGYFNRFAFLGNPTSGSAFGGPKGCFFQLQDDTATALVETYLGTDFVSRTSVTAANGSVTGLSVFDVCVTTKAIQAALGAAVTTGGRSVNIFACYETLPIDA